MTVISDRVAKIGATLATVEAVLGAGPGIRRINPSTTNVDCLALDPSGKGNPARSLVVTSYGTVTIVDASGVATELPAIGICAWEGFAIREVRAGGTCTDAILIW